MLACALQALALHPKDEIAANPAMAGGCHYAYPGPAEKIAKAPKGYKPFHISTYMRHGSRYLIGDWEYDHSLDPMLKANEAGMLTDTGLVVLDKLKRIREQSRGRMGELTPLGHRQHHGIANRMFHNFPEIFKTKGLKVNANSTDVIRCILSMESECNELKGLNPTLDIYCDASQRTMPVLNDYRRDGELNKSIKAKADSLGAYNRNSLNVDRIFKVLFKDPEWAKANLPNQYLMFMLHHTAINMQSHDDPSLDYMWLFTPEEHYQNWSFDNRDWYIYNGNTPLTGGIMPYKQPKLLQDFIEDGDRAAATRTKNATLRFGHDSVLLPTAVLMELGEFGYSTDDLSTLNDHWANYRIFPMAGNIQMVFYEKPGDKDADVLVRVLLNERDVTLPVENVGTPYFYRWKDVSDYYRHKLENCPESK